MEKKAPLQLCVIVLSLSYVVYVAAVPATRFRMTKVDLDYQAKDSVMNLRNSEKLFDIKEGHDEEGRMLMDTADYPGTGPNKHHDPKSPGKV